MATGEPVTAEMRQDKIKGLDVFDALSWHITKYSLLRYTYTYSVVYDGYLYASTTISNGGVAVQGSPSQLSCGQATSLNYTRDHTSTRCLRLHMLYTLTTRSGTSKQDKSRQTLQTPQHSPHAHDSRLPARTKPPALPTF